MAERKFSERIAEERRIRVAELHDKGLSPATIAKQLELPPAIVSADIRTLNKQLLEKFQGMTGAELLVQSNEFLEKIKEFAVREMQSSSKKIEKRINPTTGEVEDIEVVDPNKPKYLLGALKAEELRIKNLFHAGLIPKNDPKKLYEGMMDIKRKADMKQEQPSETRSRDEVLNSIDKLLKHAPRLLWTYSNRFKTKMTCSVWRCFCG